MIKTKNQLIDALFLKTGPQSLYSWYRDAIVSRVMQHYDENPPSFIRRDTTEREISFLKQSIELKIANGSLRETDIWIEFVWTGIVFLSKPVRDRIIQENCPGKYIEKEYQNAAWEIVTNLELKNSDLNKFLASSQNNLPEWYRVLWRNDLEALVKWIGKKHGWRETRHLYILQMISKDLCGQYLIEPRDPDFPYDFPFNLENNSLDNNTIGFQNLFDSETQWWVLFIRKIEMTEKVYDGKNVK